MNSTVANMDRDSCLALVTFRVRAEKLGYGETVYLYPDDNPGKVSLADKRHLGLFTMGGYSHCILPLFMSIVGFIAYLSEYKPLVYGTNTRNFESELFD